MMQVTQILLLKIFHKSNLAKGHGYSVAASAAGQGDNGYGFTGVCYDCSVYGTYYGRVRDLSELIELSEAGADVINCSWGTTKYYQTAKMLFMKWWTMERLSLR